MINKHFIFFLKDLEARILILEQRVTELEEESIFYEIMDSNESKPEFKLVTEISDDEQIEIIKIDFHRNKQGKISLKEYYEGTRFR